MKKVSIKRKEQNAREALKIEVAHELGLWDKIIKYGWAELTAEESGKIGGIMTRKMREQEKDEKINP